MARSNHQIAWRTLNNAVFDAWAALTTEPCALVPENHEATPPSSGANWAGCSIRPALTTNRALGRNEIRGTGVVMIQIFLRKGTGALQAHLIADALSVLTNTQVSAIDPASTLVVTMRATGPPTFIGPDPAGGWQLWMFEIPYHWDSVDDDTFVLAGSFRITRDGDTRLTRGGDKRIIR